MPLIIVPTPIGNLDDMTLRGLDELRAADVVACEDTRRTLGLLNRFEIKKPLISCHEHNERERSADIMRRLGDGERVALVSDAGTPGLSDPGGIIIREALDMGYEVDVLPGANALLPALLLSGIESDSFLFAGFLKGGAEDKKKRLSELKDIKETLVFYVAPHHLLKDLELMSEILGDRHAVLLREISKIHQERISGTLSSFCDTIPLEKIRGEFVCVVESASCETTEPDSDAWKAEAERLAADGLSVKDISALVSEKYGIQKNKVKKYLIENCIREA